MRQEVPVLRFLKSQDPHATHTLHLDASSSLPLHVGPQAAFSSSSPHLLAWALCHVQQFTTLSKPGQTPCCESSSQPVAVVDSILPL